ncbi:cyclic nucleotide-binding and patatin-like phospholipase domain-containing protein [Bythopirellula goksoeyrii]|uniref:NTE family protein RssA n=1 Tax=Bythopirellula goksoeyrii TaxID=1400387 RepID=A0A5B9QEU6_9BACT|nr:cyclic nucleotide-binding and patatin-like phospholipase domain-containing protein [Bythopirellula goksoeyrii]QEG37538.1 NTE family protein RssA [Bythopirellula goksoeyrii]
MNEIDEKIHLLKLHPCSRGLDHEALREIAEAVELMRCQPGDTIHRANEPMTSVYLIIHGRLRLELVDIQGNVITQRFHSSGDQIGGLAAVLAEPTPMECIAEDPSTLLRMEYARGLELTKKFDVFRTNFTRLVADSVKRTIFNDRLPTRPRFVAFVHQSDETRIVSRKLFERLVELGETPGVLTDQSDAESIEGSRCCQMFGAGRDLSVDEVRKQVAQWLETGQVFADTKTTFDLSLASNTLEKCHLAFWCVTSQNWQASVKLLREIESLAPAWRDKICILWLLEPGEDAPLARELRDLAGRDLKVSFGSPVSNQGKVLFSGFERLLHLVRGVKIGVALGGGAARGMAHLGVLKALEQSGITVDMIAGTSAGAMTGTVYAAGLDADYAVECFVNDLRPSWFFRLLPRGDQWYLLHKYRMGRFDPMLRKYLKDLDLEQLAVPMHTVTLDLIEGKSVVRSGGDAVHGILESINLPVLSTPINRSGQALVDGGLINNIPADVLVAKGCNFVIAVSVTAKMESEFARNRPDTPASQMRSASTIQTILRSFQVQSTNINAIGVQPADFVIEPDVTGFELTGFTRTDELAAIGEQATTEAIPEIKNLLHRLDAELFPAFDG